MCGSTSIARRGSIAVALLAALTALPAVGCMATAPPGEARTETVAAIRAANEMGAASQPRAAYHLELAEEQLERAEELIERGRMDRAAGLLARAEADAELAIALTREAAMEAEAEQTRERIRETRDRL